MNGIGSDAYNALLVLHLLSVIAAFGPTFAYALLGRVGGDAAASKAAQMHGRQSVPALVAALATGIALIIVSDKAYDFSMTWVSAAFTIVLVLLGLSFLLIPALRTMGNDEGSRKRAAMLTGFFHLGLVILVVLMVWKPGA